MAETHHVSLERLLFRTFASLPWGLILVAASLCGIGVAMMYSAAGGDFDPWARRQLVHIALGAIILFGITFLDLRTLYSLAYPIYFLMLLLLLAVEIVGQVGMGAQRWISIGGVNLQPSEFMKLALILVLARYFHNLNYSDIGRFSLLFPPLFLILLPVALILRQPNLGTATITAMIGVTLLFCAGVRWWKFAIAGVAGLVAAPIGWMFLHDYQKRRVMTFLDPESDPLGAGYNIMQSKIAIGSGGLFGKGFMGGSQSQLSFLPEKHTDFVFTMIAEEFGFTGGLVLLGLYALLLAYALKISLTCVSQFGRLIAMGISALLFVHIFINIGMVMGLLPVVGVPLPFLSYGGTMMLSTLTSIGLLTNVHLHSHTTIKKNSPLSL